MKLTMLVLALLAGCGAATPAEERPAESPAVVADTITPRFCAYGGVGIVPDPLPPGYETQFATIVFSIEHPGAPVPLTITGGALVDESGAPLASLVRVDHFVVLDTIEPEGPTMGSFAVYLSPTGTPFDGTLSTGTTILRAHFSLDVPPSAFPAHCRLDLDAGGRPLTVTSDLDGVWPTS